MKKNRLIVSIIVIAVVVIGAILIAMLGRKGSPQIANNTENTNSYTPPQTETVSSSTPNVPTVATYKDGTYSATGTYNSPAGKENIEVSITLKEDIITDATVTPEATDPISQKHQNQFVGGYKSLVIGKNIDDVELSGDISGSSLTPMGFDNAVAQIKSEAKA